MRKRRLPAEQVLWLVIGIALYRDRAIHQVADSLDLAIPGGNGPSLSSSAASMARDRLGESPLEYLFGVCAQHWAHTSGDQHRWHGLALYGADGTTLRVADSEQNREHFGLADGGPRGKAAYPQVRLVALAALRSHVLAAASFGPYAGPYATGENTLASELWKELPDNSLCIVDRNFLAANVLVPIQRDGQDRHWLTRAKKNTKWKVLETLSPTDLLVELTVSSEARRKNPGLPKAYKARALRYQRPGFQPQWLLTSMLDTVKFPAKDIVPLYHERWEIEMAYDEIKTDMLDREETIRSQRPSKVRQEIWGILIAFNLVRLEMAAIADEAEIEPTRISFVTALNLICDEWIWSASASPGAIPKQLRRLRADIQRFILPPRRSKRSYPLAVKIKMSSYPKKRRPDPPKDAK